MEDPDTVTTFRVDPGRRFQKLSFSLLSIAALLSPSAVEAIEGRRATGHKGWYVDDDAPNDPGPGDPLVSDPGEHGSQERPFDAIQEALDAASSGDTIAVCPGTYAGPGNRDLDFKGKAVVLRSLTGAKGCVIDCEGGGRAFSFHGGENRDSVVEGFTITAGRARCGGAVYCSGSSPTIRNNVITGNVASEGGAISCSAGSAPLLLNNVIAKNSAAVCGSACDFVSSSPIIINNTVARNRVGSSRLLSKTHNIKVLSDKIEDVSSMEALVSSFIGPGMTDEEKAIAVWTAVVKFRHQDSPPEEFLPGHVHDPVKTFNVYGYCQCCCAAATVVAIARAAGFDARSCMINAHTVAEVFYDEGWHMLDAALICYFRSEDGEIAGVEEIIDAVSEWFDEHPDYKGDLDKLRTVPKEDGPEMFSTCPFFDQDAKLPTRIHTMASTMLAYDGTRNLVWEFSCSQGHRCPITLRRNERLERHWYNSGGHINMLGGFPPACIFGTVGQGPLRYSPAYGDLAPGRVGCGTHVYRPNFADASYRGGVESEENLLCTADDSAAPALHLDDPREPGVLVFRMRSPYVCLGGKVTGQLAGGTLAVGVSTNNGLDYTEVGCTFEAGTFEFDVSVLIFRRYCYHVKLLLSGHGAGLESLELSSDLQVSQRALPALAVGKNLITVTAGPAEATLTIEGSCSGHETRNETYLTYHAHTEGLEENGGIWIAEDRRAPVEDLHGYLTFPVACPGPIRAIRCGGTYRARKHGAGVGTEASFDGGCTWTTISDAPGPYIALSKYGRLDEVPPGETGALVRYHIYGPAPAGVFSYRIDVDYDESFHVVQPFEVVYVWTEGGVEKRHEQLITSLPASYAITVGDAPVMKSILIEAAGAQEPLGGALHFRGSSATIANCVFWDNATGGAPEISLAASDSPSAVSISFCGVQGGREGVEVGDGCTLGWDLGNIEADPLFADPAQGDYHISSEHGRWDAAAETWTLDDATSPCVDAGDPASDHSDEPTPGRVNMGAYGNTPEASKSGWPVPGDVNGDCRVNILDMICVRNRLGRDPAVSDNWKADINRDGSISILDIMGVRNRLGTRCR